MSDSRQAVKHVKDKINMSDSTKATFVSNIPGMNADPHVRSTVGRELTITDGCAQLVSPSPAQERVLS